MSNCVKYMFGVVLHCYHIAYRNIDFPFPKWQIPFKKYHSKKKNSISNKEFSNNIYLFNI